VGGCTRTDELDAGKKTVETLRATKNQSQTASLLRISFDQMHRIMKWAVERGLRRRDPNQRYEHLSFDEKAVGRGHDYLTILSDAREAMVLDVKEGRTQDSVDQLCTQALSLTQRAAVKTVGPDMWSASIYGARRYFPEALHCFDNFH
jgi:transposase